MSLTPEQTQALRVLVESSHDLQERLQQSTDAAGAAATLAAAAAKAGLAIDAAALGEHFAEGLRQAQSGGLRDEQLDAVSGGYFSPHSIQTAVLGIACRSRPGDEGRG